jgi:hypothetical protein
MSAKSRSPYAEAPMNRPFIAFHFGLVQDVAVLRPVAHLAAGDPSKDIHLLVSPQFDSLDIDGKWFAEIQRLGSEIGSTPVTYQEAFDVLRLVGPGHGMIVAGSESDAKAHQKAHELFLAMPGRIRTVALQHGFECVGFLHNAKHDSTAGTNVRFAADINVAWFEPENLRSVSAREQSKIYVAGPPSMIDLPPRKAPEGGSRPGLVCENLHSVRFANAGLRGTFFDTFTSFAKRLDLIGEKLVLRPHPAGQFTQRKGLAVPQNVELSDRPLYDMSLEDFAYIISAPSTILFDFVLAGVPAAIWADTQGQVDGSNFAGLPQVATVDDWWRLHWAARLQSASLVEKQEEALAGWRLPTRVADRYRALLAVA